MSSQAPLALDQFIEQGIFKVINEMMAERDSGETPAVTLTTRLIGDLEFESIEIVQLAVALGQHFDYEEVPFERLFMRDGDYVEDLTVAEIATFLRSELEGWSSPRRGIEGA
jgi:acyl carrier protein